MMIPLLTGYVKGGLPRLVVVNPHGQVLADSPKGSTYLGPPAALQELGKIPRDCAAK